MSKGRIAVGLAIGALAIAGCGSSSNSSQPSVSQFKSAFAAERAKTKSLGTDVVAAVQGAGTKSAGALATEFASLSSQTTKAADAFRSMPVPDKYKSQVTTLANALDAAAADMKKISQAAQSNDAAAARSAAESLVKHAEQVQSTDRALTKALGLPNSG